MRVEINLPDDKKFLDKLQKLADAENRSRKNWLETLVINTVNTAAPVQAQAARPCTANRPPRL